MTSYWKFHDPEGVLDDYVFATNPNQRDDPEMDEPMESLPMGIDGSLAAMPSAPAPSDWSFKGICFNLADLAHFEDWMDNGRNIHLTDHHNQKWLVQIRDLDSERRYNRRHPEMQVVTIHCMMFGKVA